MKTRLYLLCATAIGIIGLTGCSKNETAKIEALAPPTVTNIVTVYETNTMRKAAPQAVAAPKRADVKEVTISAMSKEFGIVKYETSVGTIQIGGLPSATSSAFAEFLAATDDYKRLQTMKSTYPKSVNATTLKEALKRVNTSRIEALKCGHIKAVETAQSYGGFKIWQCVGLGTPEKHL